MAKAALISVAVVLTVTGCGPSEPDLSDYTKAEVRAYCQMQHRAVLQAPVTVSTEDEAFDRYVDCIQGQRAQRTILS